MATGLLSLPLSGGSREGAEIPRLRNEWPRGGDGIRSADDETLGSSEARGECLHPAAFDLHEPGSDHPVAVALVAMLYHDCRHCDTLCV